MIKRYIVTIITDQGDSFEVYTDYPSTAITCDMVSKEPVITCEQYTIRWRDVYLIYTRPNPEYKEPKDE